MFDIGKVRPKSLQDAIEDESTDDKTLKPYKKDLEYLDDHFQLIQHKLKVRSVDSRMEEEVTMKQYASLKQLR